MTKKYYLFYKLITHEDGYHVHKILGIFALTNFCYRYASYFRHGTMFLDTQYGLYSLVLHALLSVSSLMFHIPSVRNMSHPMIYPEFRLHSIVFALRSIACSFLHYYNAEPILIYGVCILTMLSADFITWTHKKMSIGTTMRCMPYPEEFSIETRRDITKMHSYSQIGATLYMLGNMETSFAPLLAIQTAALLMTLVRKNIIDAKTWHALYSLSLWSNYLLLPSLGLGKFLLIQLLFHIHYFYVFPYRINKYLAWCSHFLVAYYFSNNGIEQLINSNFQNEMYESYLWYFIRVIYVFLFFKYRILFWDTTSKD